MYEYLCRGLLQRAGDRRSCQKALRKDCARCVSKHSEQEGQELDRAQIIKVLKARERIIG